MREMSFRQIQHNGSRTDGSVSGTTGGQANQANLETVQSTTSEQPEILPSVTVHCSLLDSSTIPMCCHNDLRLVPILASAEDTKGLHARVQRYLDDLNPHCEFDTISSDSADNPKILVSMNRNF